MYLLQYHQCKPDCGVAVAIAAVAVSCMHSDHYTSRTAAPSLQNSKRSRTSCGGLKTNAEQLENQLPRETSAQPSGIVSPSHSKVTRYCDSIREYGADALPEKSAEEIEQ